MFATRSLLQSCRITLFTRSNCGLCSQAKGVLSDVWDRRPFDFKEVDLAEPSQRSWKDLYDFDIPVIHISKAGDAEEEVSKAGKAVKLMHRFTPEQVQAKMDHVEKK
ncbi:hypothetical protein S40285_09867 [Stachybotrys chlorohalonatus IBT 40285]|uniref:Glutaredoxin-like protein n=1 Tax=Stachybotrys chlorohalonatus (strain IBT 40285) TaxID=1283841 RepID=A0A084QJI9_STAC4|nr:hypothetical protein S40285_09867 [Stachybotrys chlorohalonata IBT 40285]